MNLACCGLGTSATLSQDDAEEQEERAEKVEPVSDREDPLDDVEVCATIG